MNESENNRLSAVRETSGRFWDAMRRSDVSAMHAIADPTCRFVHIGVTCGLEEEAAAFAAHSAARTTPQAQCTPVAKPLPPKQQRHRASLPLRGKIGKMKSSKQLTPLISVPAFCGICGKR